MALRCPAEAVRAAARAANAVAGAGAGWGGGEGRVYLSPIIPVVMIHIHDPRTLPPKP